MSDDQIIEVIRKAEAFAPGDVMGGDDRREVKVHEHGMVALVDVMPRLAPHGRTADFAIVQAARTSYGQGLKSEAEDRRLIRYLMRHRHTTPFEMVEFKLHVRLPIFVARQWIRHRTASVNEFSARYSVVPDRFYRPSCGSIRQQGAANKQGGEGDVDTMTASFFGAYLEAAEEQYLDYQRLLEKGVSRELARIGLPLSTYTEWYWQIDLHNLFHFLKLRLDPHAQREIRDYAEAMYSLIRPIVPVACEAFEDYVLGSITLTRPEIEALRSRRPLDCDNQRERDEWAAKRDRMGL